MLCYKGIAYCTAGKDCVEQNCNRRLTAKVHREAEKAGLPLQLVMKVDECFKPNKKPKR